MVGREVADRDVGVASDGDLHVLVREGIRFVLVKVVEGERVCVCVCERERVCIYMRDSIDERNVHA